MCREEVKSRRHVRRDTACDGFIEALDLRNIEHKIDQANAHVSLPFGVRYQKEIQQNRLRQLRPEPVIGQPTEQKYDANIPALPPNVQHCKVNEYLLRFEPLETNSNESDSNNPQWERWFKSKELCFVVIQKMAQDLGRLTQSCQMIVPSHSDWIKLYCDDPMNKGTEKRIMPIENEKHLTEIGALICEIFPIAQHNEIVKAQQDALTACDRSIDMMKEPSNVRQHLFVENTAESLTEKILKIPTSENSSAKPFRMFYSVKLPKKKGKS